jgi:hypothetical protein
MTSLKKVDDSQLKNELYKISFQKTGCSVFNSNQLDKKISNKTFTAEELEKLTNDLIQQDDWYLNAKSRKYNFFLTPSLSIYSMEGCEGHLIIS